ncbi:amidohydrolase family protein [Gordonia hydrophobica]|uniref:Amidohydrolase family protein n=1 Tax=Gordonia hydrophobica TaxID=40516 RepID=A0ABZ2TZY6_9ACTN|nr:amidohydrolase family protein [Gordonia hydrophobica]MBM7369262.1 putative amidohydrolase YtcJ [Gordonia hydrophobica]
MLIVGGSLLNGRRADVRIIGDRIVEVAPSLAPTRGEEEIDVLGGTILPGLHDHHVHLRAMAAAALSVRLDPATVRGRVGLAESLAVASPDAVGWIRAVGYHESIAGDLDRHLLDALDPVRPVRIQHRTGAMWFVNTPGLRLLGLADHPTGRVYRDDHVLAAHTSVDTDLTVLGHDLAALGITGVTEATPDLTDADLVDLRRALTDGALPQRLHVLRAPGESRHPRLTHGPTKRIIDDDVDCAEFTDWLTAQRRQARPVAVHCVTVLQLVVTITALREVGTLPGDRIEHAAVVPDDLLATLGDLGITVVTQPNFVSERGDQYLADVPADELPGLWRLASLIEAGVPLAGSTDAPFGHHDSWAAMRAACARRAPSGATIGENERLSPRAALGLFLGRPDAPAQVRRVEIGAVADLCLARAAPEELLEALSAETVVGVVIGGQHFSF